MQVPPEIVFQGVRMTPDIEKVLNRGIARLERVCNYIVSIHIALERAQGRRQTGNPYRMRIDIRIPDRSDIVVNRQSKAAKKSPVDFNRLKPVAPGDEPEAEEQRLIEAVPVRRQGAKEEPLLALIRRTFDSARRELEKTVEKQRGEIKVPARVQRQAVVEKLFPEQQYGFLRTLDGQEVYFHKNSVLHANWRRLRVGTLVEYAAEMGEKGLQASTVKPADKPGAAEERPMHDLPGVPLAR